MVNSKTTTNNTNQQCSEEEKSGFFGGVKMRAKAAAFATVGFASTAPIAALASEPPAPNNDDFAGFAQAMSNLVTGSAGKGIALIALLLGGLIGLAKSSAWPALTGLAIAAIFGLGPFLINTIFGTFGKMTYGG